MMKSDGFDWKNESALLNFFHFLNTQQSMNIEIHILLDKQYKYHTSLSKVILSLNNMNTM